MANENAPNQPIPRTDGLGEEQWWIEDFKEEVFHLAQQKQSKLRGAVRNRVITGDVANFERLAASSATQKTTRHTETPILDVDHSRRRVSMQDWHWSDLVDPQDVRRMLANPIGAYSTNCAMAIGRKWDDLILGSDGAATPAIVTTGGLLGGATDGDGSAVAYDTTNQAIASGSEGMTISKLTEAKYILDDNDVAMENRTIVVGPSQLRDLLNTTEATSADYNTVKSLVKGEIQTFMGFNFVVSTRLPLVSAERACVVFQKDAAGLAIAGDMKIRRDERPDLSYAHQIYAEFTANATRIDDAGVVRILCTES